MINTRTPRSRRALLGVVGVLFLVTAAVAFWRVFALREVAVERERVRLQLFVEEQVAAWEEKLFDELGERMEEMASNPDHAGTLQNRWRQKWGWFDSLFLWKPGADNLPALQLFPLPSAPDASLHRQVSPCLGLAHHSLAEHPDDLDRAVALLVRGCEREDPSVAVFAATNAAQLLAGAGRIEEALAVLEVTSPPEKLSMREAGRKGIEPGAYAAFRTLQVDLLLRTGRKARALDLASRVGDQLTDLDAPDLANAQNLYVPGLRQALQRNGRVADAKRLEERSSRADRRYRAYGEIRTRLLFEPLRSGNGRMVVDAYSDRPFLLYYGWAEDYGVAFVLEEGPLVETLLRARMGGLQSALTLTDSRNGRFVGGARSGGGYAITVPFPRSLTHLRVHVRQSAIDAAVGNHDEQWIVPGVIIGVALVLALFMLAAVDRAMQQQVELLDRQRAFSTRVTHELKTPLAGIRVMAENLEIGAFRDETQRRDMARRIMQEADTLTRRVDEVLALAKERHIPSPVAFDVEEIVYLLLEEWGPRFRDAGVELAVDVAPVDPVLGDPNALRDAIACLLDNALKYRNEARPDPRVSVDVMPDGRSVVILVKDNGLGVPKAMRKRIFERFVRVEGPHRGKAGGHGLGLHQVREIVAAHHGTVTCVDGVDGGAAFVVRVPTARSPSSPTAG